MKHGFASALLAMIFLCLSACGGGGDSDGGTEPPDDVPSPPAVTANCQNDYNPDRINAGENCAPVTGSFCQVPSGLLPDELTCDGVSISTYPVTGGGLSSSYIALRNSSRPPEAIYLALHYLGARATAFANVVRLPELARGRDVLVLVPQAPSSVLGLLPLPANLQLPLPVNLNLTSRWPSNVILEPVGKYVEFLDAVVADARSRYATGNLPLYVAGLSNGGVMSYLYACAAADHVDAVLTVAGGSMAPPNLTACEPSRPFGSVIVHGTADLLSPYSGRPVVSASIPSLYTFFKGNNGCADDRSAEIPASAGDRLPVQFLYTAPCDDHRRSLLVSIVGGGHNWPGEEVSDEASNLGLLGPKSTQFDATLQGYDLLRYAAGH